MSMGDRSYCGTECTNEFCERNMKFNKPRQRIYTVSYFDEDNSDSLHRSCEHRIPIEADDLIDRLRIVNIENNNLKQLLNTSIPRRRVRRVYKQLREILAEGDTEDTKKYIKILQDFTRKIETDGDQIAGQEIKTAIQHLLSMREVD